MRSPAAGHSRTSPCDPKSMAISYFKAAEHEPGMAMPPQPPAPLGHLSSSFQHLNFPLKRRSTRERRRLKEELA
jgi:hypothetical protein